ncbi:hypothetical protein FH609_014600 [Streptomyces sp. 3MP-14]|uniref:Glycosyl hydrolase family 5 n=1 Tax=Streptomyces mimosae TaxID=2586635 RepID=A0A5N5ZXN1_9ACTN|nr:hypothetical protein FH607_027510 [Streptomyces mimosae]KAB8176691.1 hypothetical protein FH609_014600 [Streptomyces sp. 3MP-14]
MPSRKRLLATAIPAVLASVAATFTLMPGSAQADELICDQYGTTVIQNRYIAQNNRWGTQEEQCINVTDSGFQLVTANGSVPTNGAPKSYPSVYDGCHYGNCSPGTALPRQVSQIGSAPSSVSYTYVDNASYNASYDIWLDPEPQTTGVSETEIMIWLNRVGPIQPIGSPTGTANIAGQQWEVWEGNNGGNDVISFIAPSAITSFNFDVMDFVDETVAHGLADPSWYITSVQAGFEPWENGAGLALNSFSSSFN